jgi:hypothetical protein
MGVSGVRVSGSQGLPPDSGEPEYPAHTKICPTKDQRGKIFMVMLEAFCRIADKLAPIFAEALSKDGTGEYDVGKVWFLWTAAISDGFGAAESHGCPKVCPLVASANV